MIKVLRHRGPDDTGFYRDNWISLAHARLSIIDLAGGKQPVHNEDRTVWVIFNGEIFNFVELREELVRTGNRFYTHSDTEVIVHTYEEYGEDFVQHLNGQFAIALWDRRKQRLFLARDRVGIRPLFYTEVGGRLLFASEIKSLLAVPDVERRLNPQALAQVFTFWTPIAPTTPFEGIMAVPPGYILTVDVRSSHRRLSCYWDWKFPQASIHSERSASDLAEELRALLIDSVRLQLRSDVPVGAYLSGGLDSSVITALIRHYTDSPLRTFSITFEDSEFDESHFQHALVRHLGTQHSIV